MDYTTEVGALTNVECLFSIRGGSMSTGWERLWRDGEVRQQWQGFEPLPGVAALGDTLVAGGGRRVLDLGCGLGRHTLYLAARGLSVVGIDNAPTALTECRRHLGQADLNAALAAADMLALPFRDHVFDAVIAALVVQHARRSQLAGIIADITRVLTDRGWLFLVIPTPRHRNWGRGTQIEPGTWVDPTHPEGTTPHTYLEEGEVRTLLAGYEILSLHEVTFTESGERSRRHWHVTARRRG
jgi:tellurite methyltransferase